MFYLLLATYGTVLFAELIGDKSLYTISSLTTRFRPLHVLCGVTVAFAGKTLVAVLIGQTIAELPSTVVACLSAATFFATALVIWFKKPEKGGRNRAVAQYWPRAAAVSFAAIFFTEWGDVGQIAVATMVARYHAPLIIWFGATAALVTKGLLAITLGTKLRELIPPRVLRYAAFTICLVMSILAAFKIN